MNNRQRKTLESILKDPVSANNVWKDIESMLNALGCEITEGGGYAPYFIVPIPISIRRLIEAQ